MGGTIITEDLKVYWWWVASFMFYFVDESNFTNSKQFFKTRTIKKKKIQALKEKTFKPF